MNSCIRCKYYKSERVGNAKYISCTIDENIPQNKQQIKAVINFLQTHDYKYFGEDKCPCYISR